MAWSKASKLGELAAQARENISSEIRDNKRELEAERGKVAANRKDTQRALDLVQQLLAHRKLTELSIHLGANGATLNSASWTTASSTGALEFMGYAETKRFAQAYQLQEILLRLQEEEFRSVAATLGELQLTMHKPEQASQDSLRNLERDLLACEANATVWDQLAEQLSRQYEQALEAH